jgi:hypothetical protein
MPGQMEADWEFEIGNDAPIIETHWEGFVDLRVEPNRAGELEETLQLPGLVDALVRLNSPTSPTWTCKTDVFVPERIDPDELDATSAEASQALACYIDLLPRFDQRWDAPARAEAACREMCARLRDVPMRRCRVDFVIRQAHIEPGLNDLGATAYLTACGPTPWEARSWLTGCVSLFAELIVPEPRQSTGAPV